MRRPSFNEQDIEPATHERATRHQPGLQVSAMMSTIPGRIFRAHASLWLGEDVNSRVTHELTIDTHPSQAVMRPVTLPTVFSISFFLVTLFCSQHNHVTQMPDG